jgi:predicted RNA-binding Zn ribbon-like protein
MTQPHQVVHEDKPAPPPLLAVQSFVNTWDLEVGTDLLADAGTANDWLREAGLLGPKATADAGELRVAREFRESIRALLARNGRGPAPAVSELGAVEAVARASRPRLTIDPSGQVQLGPGPEGRLADGLTSLLLIIRDAQRDGTWPRLKVCANPDCLWAFYDRSHSRRGAWCDMASCGNIIKNRNLRSRRARSGSPTGEGQGELA